MKPLPEVARGIRSLAWKTVVAALACWLLLISPALGAGQTVTFGNGETVFNEDGTVTISRSGKVICQMKNDNSIVKPPMIEMSYFCPNIGLVRSVHGDQTHEAYHDQAEDHFLRVTVDRRDGNVFKKTFTRLTLRDKILVRERETVEELDSQGRWQVTNWVCGHYVVAPLAGLPKFFLDPKDTETCLRSLGDKVGPDPKDPWAGCDLDDPQKVSDEQLEKFATDIWKAYDNGPAWKNLYLRTVNNKTTAAMLFSTFYVGRADDGYLHCALPWPWRGQKVLAAKFAHGLNPDYPPDLKRKAIDAGLNAGQVWVDYHKTWYRYVRAAAVTEKGTRRDDQPRVVEFLNSDIFGGKLFKVIQTMDYAAAPRPKITSYKIERLWEAYLVDGQCKQGESLPADDCTPVKVEIEDVQSDDPALAGEWIRNVVLKDPAPRP
jgi:hypothetical protein